MPNDGDYVRASPTTANDRSAARSSIPSTWGLQSGVPRPVDHAKREELLATAGSILARMGVIDTSLRTLAAEMGMSARMLVYYFGSKEHLILEVMIRQQRAAIPATDDVERPVSVAAHRQWCFEDWRECTRGERSETLRVVLQVFGAACGRDSPYRTYTWETLSLLTRNSQARLESLGMSRHVAETRSRIALAAFQGFIIEYFTADDPRYVDETFARFVDEFLLAPWQDTPPSPPDQPRHSDE
jgi:AcrR family transcriptional regulator